VLALLREWRKGVEEGVETGLQVRSDPPRETERLPTANSIQSTVLAGDPELDLSSERHGYGLTVFYCRLELISFDRLNGFLIQAVPELLHYPNILRLPVFVYNERDDADASTFPSAGFIGELCRNRLNKNRGLYGIPDRVEVARF